MMKDGQLIIGKAFYIFTIIPNSAYNSENLCSEINVLHNDMNLVNVNLYYRDIHDKIIRIF